jgi:hypothetical protein
MRGLQRGPSLRVDFVDRRGDGEIPRLTLFARDVFVTREKRILLVAFSRED